MRSAGFAYDESPGVSFLSTVVQSGPLWLQQGSAYLTKSLPPMEFEYTTVPTPEQLAKLVVREVDPKSRENLTVPTTLLPSWVDLNVEGLPSALTEVADGWFYKRNTSASNRARDRVRVGGERTDARFAAFKILPTKPRAPSLASGRMLFIDVRGDGLVDLVQRDDSVHGFYPRANGR
jgi:hypothetical protein